MKVGIFTDSYKPYTSGVVTSISTFKEELARLGHEIYIFAPSYPNHEDTEENVYRFYSLPSPTNSDYTLAIPVLPGLNMLVKKLDLDIIHVHSPFTMGRVGLRYARKYHLPILFTYHTLYEQYVHYVPLAQELAREVAIKYSSRFCNQCDHIIAPSNELKDVLEGYEVKSPISVIPTGVPINKFKNVNDKDWLYKHYNIPEKNKILLFVGRLAKEKNLEFLIESFAQIKNTKPNTTLVITAQGPLENELKKLTLDLGLSLEHDVVFTGALPFDTLLNVYNSADLFVFASVTETQGLVLIEAMAAGLPVVAVSAYGVQDMVDHNINGYLTKNEKNDFSQAVCSILNNKELYDQMKNNAILKADALSSQNMARKLEDLYIELVSKKLKRQRRLIDVGSWLGS
ncbi:Glycosyltransferase [Candidatus Syntrophocurvum alkaliphilum]|uniref:Glycosyltransferase n=1 Tax=Candidatus Syntrophocurvum alkaliphilum TaxID=2293317 RepID=A0A6I6DFE1_9FIRM|nr:glycosyltransferase family 4 protein [Candidatus Syntrophocurvum alkaliphilum]QGT99682.1 Glycosyltransferase [Candidatus Syntrophocurvum alkaliphilum]